MQVYYNSKGCLFIHLLLLALSAAPLNGRFKYPGLNSKYNLFLLSGAVCEKYNTGYVTGVQKEELPFHLSGDPAE